ncbi:MAG: hypothetical protein JWO86_7055 [Myxococcaceae bacterium]|nr:hypothetical protein [Myxococcaceae bacterium]
MRRHLVVIFAVSTVVFGGALASACSSSTNEATPSRPVIPPVDSSVAIDDGGVDGDAAAVDAASCNGGPQGCFTCEPVQLDDFLNACTDGQCTPFDNVARLPLYKAGQALPPVP